MYVLLRSRRKSLLSPTGKWTLTLLFALTTLGLPLEDWIATVSSAEAVASACTTTSGAGCQCSSARRRTGRCCCQLARRPAETASCCAKRAETVAKKTCCSSQKKAVPAEETTGPSITSCGCGSAEDLGLLWSGEPRLAVRPMMFFVIAESRVPFSLGNDTVTGTRSRPDIPPPRDRLLSV